MRKFGWDELDIIEIHAEYLMEEDKSLTKEQAFEKASNDDFIFDDEWDFFIEDLTELMKEVKNYSGYWRVIGKNMGWRNLTGTKLIEADNARKLIAEMLPATQFTIRGKKYNNRLEMVVSHHDSPMGETYVVKPIAYSTHERGL